jgi:hypothetical protein
MGTITDLQYWKIQRVGKQLESGKQLTGRDPVTPDISQKIQALDSRLEAISITLSKLRKGEHQNVRGYTVDSSIKPETTKDTGRIGTGKKETGGDETCG